MHADSAVAIDFCRKSCIGRMRHLAVGQLWVPEHLRRGAFTLFKVRGDSNPADLCTKHLDRTTASYLLDLAGITFEDGAPAEAVCQVRAHEGNCGPARLCACIA